MSYPQLGSESTPLLRGKAIPKPEGVFDESSRKPTDRFWLFPFVVAVIAFIVVAVLSGCSGDLKGLANNRKNISTGPTCGFDSNVLDSPYVLYVDERDCMQKNVSEFNCAAPWICVKSCPKGLFDVTSCTTTNFPELKENLACQTKEARDSVINCDTLKKAVQLDQCAAWFNSTSEAFGYCHSKTVKDSGKSGDFAEFQLDLGELFRKIAPSFALAIVIAVAVSFFFIITLKWSAAFVFWGFVGVVMTLLAGIIIAIGVVIGTAANNAQDKKAAEQAKTGLYIYLGLMIFFFFIFILCLYLFRRKIRCGIEIVKESSRAVTCSYSSICFPLLPFIIRAVIGLTLIFAVIMAMLIRTNFYSVHGSLSSSDCTCSNSGYSVGSTCLPEQFNKDCHTSTGGICEVATCKLDEQIASSSTTIYILVLVFCGMWIVAFVQANTKMVLAHVFGNWYWNWNQEFIPSGAVCTAMGKILGNHTGTAAFGSLIITICRILKSLLNSRERSEGEGGIGAVIMRIIGEIVRACAQVLLDIIEFVSDKAFVCCAIMGTDFWESVKGVSKIMVKDIPLVVATEYVGDIILFVCKFVAALASSGLFYVLAPFKDDEKWITIVFAIVIFVFAYDLASILLTAYDVAIDTLLVCGLHDYMHNKAEKAYFQSETLNELLLQKNTA